MTCSHQEFNSRLEKILSSDSKARFVKLLQDHPTEVTSSLVDKCVDFGAKKCLAALVSGQVCNLYPAINTQLPESGVSALAYAAHSYLEPNVIDAMVTRCGAIPLVNVPCTIGVVHGLPIHFVLINLSFLEHMYHWVRGNSLINLIILLCQWETKPILDSVRLLAEHTNSINDVAWTFLKNGGVKQFAALLLVAREKVLTPFDTGLTINQCIATEIDSVSKTDGSPEQEEYKCRLMDAQRLYAVFEKAGDDLSSYCSSMQKSVPVATGVSNVCKLLRKANILVTTWDLEFDLSFPKCKMAEARLLKLVDSHGDNALKVFPSPYPSSYRHLFGNTRIPIPKIACLSSQPRGYSTIACQAGSICKALEPAGVNPLLYQLSPAIMKLTKGFSRFL